MNRTPGSLSTKTPSANRRLQWWYGVMILILVIIIARLFYLQIIRHDHYRQQALSSQLKEYNIEPDRGVIRAHDAGGLTPLVLNDKLYTLYADPLLVKDAEAAALSLSKITGGDANTYATQLKTKDSRYVILAKKLIDEQNSQILALKLPGIGTQAKNYRTYPQGNLAAQILGFVNDDGEGTYGVEQALNKELSGVPGKLKAITDARGVPLAASRDNIQINPVSGQDLILNINLAMQKQLETVLKKGLERAISTSGSVVILEAKTGAVKAMANLPTYNPEKFSTVKDSQVFNNEAAATAYEVGSIMKPLTTAAALDTGSVTTNSSYSDPYIWKIDGYSITNVEESGGPGTKTIQDILSLSLNTGATWLLMQMGGGEINSKGRNVWHDYMTEHYRFGKKTGIEQGFEATGYIPNPNEGFGINLTYANTAFGQAMTATPLQMAAALASVVNGGTYYQPQLVDKLIGPDGQQREKDPVALKRDVVSPEVSRAVKRYMEGVIASRSFQPKFDSKYSVGGKTGTAQIANPAGGYYTDRFNGSYMGFVGGDEPQYVMAIRVKEPKVGGYAGTTGAQPIFLDMARVLIDNFGVVPKSGT